MILEKTASMPPKLASKVKKMNLILPDDLVRRIDAWRGHQPGVPNASKAIRDLLEWALDAKEAEGDKPKKAKK
jgi:metal-responsive CopG/Arc/MetJ family transcriptional regulator